MGGRPCAVCGQRRLVRLSFKLVMGPSLPSVQGPDVLGVHAQKHPLVIDLNQHHLVLQTHWVDLQDLYLFVQMFRKRSATFFIEPP